MSRLIELRMAIVEAKKWPRVKAQWIINDAACTANRLQMSAKQFFREVEKAGFLNDETMNAFVNGEDTVNQAPVEKMRSNINPEPFDFLALLEA